MKRSAFDFGTSASDRRRAARQIGAQRRADANLRRKVLKRAKRETLLRRRQQRRLDAKRKKEDQRRMKAEARAVRLERRRIEKLNRRQARGGWGSSRGDRQLRTATRLVGWLGTLMGRMDEKSQAELIAYADEHAAEIYENSRAEPEEKKPAGPGVMSRVMQGLRRLVGG